MKTFLKSVAIVGYGYLLLTGCTSNNPPSTTQDTSSPSPVTPTVSGPSVPQGTDYGSGGGTLARLLTYAKNDIQTTLAQLKPNTIGFESARLNQWYAKVFEKMAKEFATILLEPTNNTLNDSSLGYETWIRLKAGNDFIVEYNPDITRYKQLVGEITQRGFITGETIPSLPTVAEFLLHEMGHRYGLGEEDSWSFAHALKKHFKFSTPVEPIVCVLRVTATPELIIKVNPTEKGQMIEARGYQFHFLLDPNSYEFTFSIKEKDQIIMAMSFGADTSRPNLAGLLRREDFMSLYCIESTSNEALYYLKNNKITN